MINVVGCVHVAVGDANQDYRPHRMARTSLCADPYGGRISPLLSAATGEQQGFRHCFDGNDDGDRLWRAGTR